MKDDQNSPGLNTFVCELTFTGNLEEEQLKRLEVIANSCPLHKLLGKPNKIITTLQQHNPYSFQ